MIRALPFSFIAALLLFAPDRAAADTGFVISVSAGKGFNSTDPIGASQTNIMISPGFSLIDLLRIELGLVADLPDLEASKFNLQVRPSLVIAPPIIPLYGRITVGVSSLLVAPVNFTWGGSIGAQINLGPLGIFAEIGVLPAHPNDYVLVEGRLGIGYFG